MRALAMLSASLLGAALTLSQPPAASAEGDQSWQTCIGDTTKPNERVAACSTLIDAKAETGKRLAAAYCNRGHDLAEKREFDAALADLDEAAKIAPTDARLA